MLGLVLTVLNSALVVFAFIVLVKAVREVRGLVKAVERNTHSLATLVEQLKPQRAVLRDTVLEKFHDSKPDGNLFKDVVIDKASKIEIDDDETNFDRIEAGRATPENSGEFQVITPEEIKAIKSRDSSFDSDSSVIV